MILSFAAFAIEQTRGASEHQQAQLASGSTTASASSATRRAPGGPSHKGTVHKLIDEVATGLTSPFAGVFASNGSEWAIRGAKLLLALLVYGFGLGYLARVLRVRV